MGAAVTKTLSVPRVITALRRQPARPVEAKVSRRLGGQRSYGFDDELYHPFLFHEEFPGFLVGLDRLSCRRAGSFVSAQRNYMDAAFLGVFVTYSASPVSKAPETKCPM